MDDFLKLLNTLEIEINEVKRHYPTKRVIHENMVMKFEDLKKGEYYNVRVGPVGFPRKSKFLGAVPMNDVGEGIEYGLRFSFCLHKGEDSHEDHYLGDLGFTPYGSEIGDVWNPTNHVSYIVKKKRGVK